MTQEIIDSEENSALVVEGGAMRSVFSAGVLDGFIEHKFNPFQFYIGVSAGATNLITYISGEYGKSLEIYIDYALRRNFINYRRFFRGGHLLDLDWLGEQLRQDSFFTPMHTALQEKVFYICTTDVETGQANFEIASDNNIQDLIKASTSLPLLYRGFPMLEGRPMTDGGIADGIPIGEAIRLGARRIMVVRSRAKSYMKKDSLGHRFIRLQLRQFPQLTEKMRQRVKIFTDTLALLRNPPDGVEIIEICPPEQFQLGRFCRNKISLQRGYEIGRSNAVEAMKLWNQRLERR